MPLYEPLLKDCCFLSMMWTYGFLIWRKCSGTERRVLQKQPKPIISQDSQFKRNTSVEYAKQFLKRRPKRVKCGLGVKNVTAGFTGHVWASQLNQTHTHVPHAQQNCYEVFNLWSPKMLLSMLLLHDIVCTKLCDIDIYVHSLNSSCFILLSQQTYRYRWGFDWNW